VPLSLDVQRSLCQTKRELRYLDMLRHDSELILGDFALAVKRE
jgi:hypothetical protein